MGNRFMNKTITVLFGLTALAAGSARAQEAPRFTFNLGAGFTNPTGTAGDRLNTGWNFDLGGGVNLNRYVGALLKWNYNNLGMNAATLNGLGFPGGDIRVWSLTAEPIVHLFPERHFDVYLTGGGGLYHQVRELTRPAIIGTYVYNPIVGSYPAVVPVNLALESASVNKPGFNGGIGITLGTKWNAKFYVETQFHRMFLDHGLTLDYIPVTFGVRW
jgi:hypothetical protein